MDKRDREWAIFRAVYRDEEFELVVHQDLPDFAVQRRRAPSRFGVEVTALYELEADARAHNHPSYIGDLLAGGPPMHRDDIAAFPLSAATITDKDGNVKSENVPAIIRPVPSEAEHARALASVIERKAQRLHEYEQGFSHVNLIIMDWYAEPKEVHVEYSVRDFLTSDVRSALHECGFREVFVVLSALQDSKQVYRPLRMLLLLESYYVFLNALETFLSDEKKKLELEDVVPLFVHTNLDTKLSPSLVAPQVENGPCAVSFGVGIEQTSNGVRVLDFRDDTPPPSIPLPPPPLRPEEMSRFGEFLTEFARENTLITALDVDVATSVPRYG